MSIKHTIRDGLIWAAATSGLVRWHQSRQRRHGPLVRVLCLHDVPNHRWFAGLVDLLAREYALITPEQFHARQFSEERINVMLTFDDGYQSWVDVALPVLAEYDAKGLFFVTSGLLDAMEEEREAAEHFVRRRLHLKKGRQPLTWDGARELVAAGHTIGGHTVTHPSLASISSEEAAREISENKAALEQQLHVTLADFAYPFGQAHDFTSETVELVTAAGYTHQYAAYPGFVTEYGKQVSLPRTMLHEGQPPEAIKRWIDGGYDIVQKLKF